MFSTAQKRILVVDDDILVLQLVRETLAAFLTGCCVETTPNPEYAFERILRCPYDLLLIDFMMERLDGASLYALVSKVFSIRPPDGRALPPMLLLSGFASVPRAQELLRAPGVRGLIAKPFSVDRLVEQVGLALSPKAA